MVETVRRTLSDEIANHETFGPSVMYCEHWGDYYEAVDTYFPVVCVSEIGAKDLGIDAEELACAIRDLVQERLAGARR